MSVPVKAGQRVRYMPHHARGDERHPDVEYGVVTSVGESGGVFVRFDGAPADSFGLCCPPDTVAPVEGGP